MGCPAPGCPAGTGPAGVTLHTNWVREDGTCPFGTIAVFPGGVTEKLCDCRKPAAVAGSLSREVYYNACEPGYHCGSSSDFCVPVKPAGEAPQLGVRRKEDGDGLTGTVSLLNGGQPSPRVLFRPGRAPGDERPGQARSELLDTLSSREAGGRGERFDLPWRKRDGGL